MNLDVIRAKAAAAIQPLKPATTDTPASRDFLFAAKRTNAGRQLPPYYLVYFLLVDLLEFRNLGRWEKTAWCLPVDYRGTAYLIEHRKLGLGVFAAEGPQAEADATQIARLVHKGVTAAEPYLAWRAEQAVNASKLNVINKSPELFKRFEYFHAAYASKRDEAQLRSKEVIRTELPHGGQRIEHPAFGLREEAKWLALSAIESFFSWTEHVFILAAILQGHCDTGDAVAKLAMADWSAKFKVALDIADPTTKVFYDDLLLIRQQLRNLVAHGAFGKQGEAFRFHSNAGAVPVRLIARGRAPAFRFGYGVDFVEDAAIQRLQAFVAHFWSGARAPARVYLQDWQLPVILTLAQAGDYAAAMRSEADMEEFARDLGAQMDRSANMEW
ncbi:hypothetical protein [Phenylobacterium sp.]|uniref:hypothetical protein n=1 Tax=Phenylobacterium sp. TaxID=1871053 RepID=UPI003BA8B8C0